MSYHVWSAEDQAHALPTTLSSSLPPLPLPCFLNSFHFFFFDHYWFFYPFFSLYTNPCFFLKYILLDYAGYGRDLRIVDKPRVLLDFPTYPQCWWQWGLHPCHSGPQNLATVRSTAHFEGCLAGFPLDVCLCLLTQRILETSHVVQVQINWVRIRVEAGVELRWPFPLTIKCFPSLCVMTQEPLPFASERVLHLTPFSDATTLY